MRKIFAALVVSAMVTSAASAQDALAPWFDADGFYNRPGVALSRSLNDLTTCRAEALRLKTVRSTNSGVPSAMAFSSSGAYDPVVSGAATGIASIMFAIQDARYNGSIEQIEFRDCAVALGYRHFRLSDRSRARFNGDADRGFTALVAAQTPAAGERNERETERNYFAADLAANPYQNAVPQVVDSPMIQPDPVEASPEAVSAEEGVAAPDPAAPAPQPTGVIERVARGQVASHQAGMAIVVVSASQLSQSMNIPVPGDTFQFQRVTADGGFLDLLRPTVTFGVRSHMNAERRSDPTLAGPFRTPRYSTYQIPAGRYALSSLGELNACLGTLTFEVREGETAYLGDLVLQPPGLPVGSLFNPVGNIHSGMDNNLRDDLRMAIGDDLEAARAAAQVDDTAKAQMRRVTYQNDYRLPCAGYYIGRVSNPAWTSYAPDQAAIFNDAMAQAIAAAQ